MPFLFLLLGIVFGWFLNSRITQGKRILEIKKLREELTKATSKAAKVENQISRTNQKRGLSFLKNRRS